MRRINYNIVLFSMVSTLFFGGCSLERDVPEGLVTPVSGPDARMEQDSLPAAPAVRLDELARVESRGLADSPLAAQKVKQGRVAYAAMPATGLAQLRAPAEPLNRENYAHFTDNPLQRVTEDPFSTFSIDVDTGAYSNMRRMLNAGNRPLKDAIRTEELINYFSYDYPRPKKGSTPFSIITEVGPSPWNTHTHLLAHRDPGL